MATRRIIPAQQQADAARVRGLSDRTLSRMQQHAKPRMQAAAARELARRFEAREAEQSTHHHDPPEQPCRRRAER